MCVAPSKNTIQTASKVLNSEILGKIGSHTSKNVIKRKSFHGNQFRRYVYKCILKNKFLFLIIRL